MTSSAKEEPQRHPLAVELEEARQRASDALDARDREIYRLSTQDHDSKTGSKAGMTTGKIGKMFGLTSQQVRRIKASQKIRRQLHGEH